MARRSRPPPARDGSFEFSLPLASGANEIRITGTDPAGNVGSTKLTLFQGSTEMGVRLRPRRTGSLVRPTILDPALGGREDPAGEPLAGATAFFTLHIPGLAPISNRLLTGPTAGPCSPPRSSAS